MHIKLRMLFADRVGLVADVACIMAENELNIISMEMESEQQHGNALVYVDATRSDPSCGEEIILECLKGVRGLKDISVISILPRERREMRFQVVLDSISDGILAVDECGEVAVINRVATQILNCHSRDVLGRRLNELKLIDSSVLQCLDNKSFHNERRNVINEKGRFQFLATGKPIKNRKGRVLGAVEIMKDMQEIRKLASAVSQPTQVAYSDVIGQSPAIKHPISFAQKIADTDATVSIRGESGTGKELFASALHADSGRPGSFVAINCAALPDNLLESELFGYVGGAFSGASRGGKVGLFEQAQEGTLFLDEIGEMSLSLQAKMLRVLQDGKVRRIGGTKEVPVNARIITATNKNLERMVEEKRFREDLFYRINVFPLHIPPLRERGEDIPLLVEHFLFQLSSRLGKPLQSLTKGALEKLARHSWPGNVRELRNVIERAAILCTTEKVGTDCILFSFEIGKAMAGMGTPHAAGPTRGAAGNESLRSLLDRYEREIITEALEQTESKRKAAKRLLISHTTLLNKLKKHKISLETKLTTGNKTDHG